MVGKLLSHWHEQRLASCWLECRLRVSRRRSSLTDTVADGTPLLLYLGAGAVPARKAKGVPHA